MRGRTVVEMRATSLVAFITFCPVFVGCAQILGYDDLSARQDDATTGVDVASDQSIDSSEVVVETGPPSASLPVRPPGPAVPSGKGKTLWLIVRRYYLNTELRTGAVSSDAWQTFGYDIDHTCTGKKQSEENTGTCLRAAGADPDVLVDGEDCRDNNFGQWIIPKIQITNPSFEDTSNSGLAKGSSTWIFRIDDVDDGPNDPYAPGGLYRAADTGSAGWSPKYDGTDVRKIESDTVFGGDITRPTVQFVDGYVSNGVWVSGEPNGYVVSMPVGTVQTNLTIIGATFDFTLSDDHKTATNGTVAGAIPFASFDDLLRPIAEHAGFCPGSDLYTQFTKTVSLFPDISVDSPGSPILTKPCDGISLGLGFDLAPIMPPTELQDPPAPGPPACADAGVDGG